MSVIERGAAIVSRGVAAWSALAPRVRMGALAGISALALVLVVWLASDRPPCGERTDVEARVAELSAGLQADAAAGTISIEVLATRIKLLNAAATAFETSKDLGAYCAQLDDLNKQFGGQAR